MPKSLGSFAFKIIVVRKRSTPIFILNCEKSQRSLQQDYLLRWWLANCKYRVHSLKRNLWATCKLLANQVGLNYPASAVCPRCAQQCCVKAMASQVLVHANINVPMLQGEPSYSSCSASLLINKISTYSVGLAGVFLVLRLQQHLLQLCMG